MQVKKCSRIQPLNKVAQPVNNSRDTVNDCIEPQQKAIDHARPLWLKFSCSASESGELHQSMVGVRILHRTWEADLRNRRLTMTLTSIIWISGLDRPPGIQIGPFQATWVRCSAGDYITRSGFSDHGKKQDIFWCPTHWQSAPWQLSWGDPKLGKTTGRV